jgi:hypothetical protein
VEQGAAAPISRERRRSPFSAKTYESVCIHNIQKTSTPILHSKLPENTIRYRRFFHPTEKKIKTYRQYNQLNACPGEFLSFQRTYMCSTYSTQYFERYIVVLHKKVCTSGKKEAKGEKENYPSTTPKLRSTDSKS